MKARGLRWKPGRYSATYGGLNGMMLFTISYRMTNRDPKTYSMSTQLPGVVLSDEQRWYDSIEEAKVAAQVVLQAFVSSLVES